MTTTKKVKMAFPVKFPQFSGEKEDDTWKGYKSSMELAYLVAGIEEIDDEQRAAHLLHGLTGKARRFLELHPELMGKTYQEIDQILGDRFGKASAKNLIDIHRVVQMPGETVLEYVARLKRAAEMLQEDNYKPTITTKEQIDTMGPEEAKKLNVFTLEEYKKARNLVQDSFNKFLLPHFIKGLNKKVKDVVTREMPETFEQALKIAEDYERFMESFGDITNSSAGIALVQGQLTTNDLIEEVAEQLQSLNITPKSKDQGKGEASSPGIQAYPEERACFYCKKQGHLKSQCRLRLQHLRENQQPDPSSRYRPYSLDRRPFNGRPPYGNNYQQFRYIQPTYSQERPPYRGYQRPYPEDPRQQNYRYQRDQNGRQGTPQGNPFVQPRMRDMRPQGAGGHRERYPRIPGESRQKMLPIPNPIKRYEKYEETEEEKRHFDGPKNKEKTSVPIAEVNHQYAPSGPRRGQRNQERSQSKNGERRTYSRGPRLPAQQQYMRSMRKH